MSKTTKKLGKPNYTLHAGITANVKPSRRLLKNWAKLDEHAQAEFGKPYDALTSRQKTELHFNINTGRYDKDGDVPSKSGTRS